MSERGHLDLPPVKRSFKKKPRRGGPLKAIDRNYTDFSETQISKLDELGTKFKTIKEELPDYDQELVFKIKTTQKVSDDQFRMDLKRAGIDTLISNPGKETEWIVSTKDPSFSKFKNKIKKRIEKEKSDFIDGIDTVIDFSIEDKKGPLLKQKPLSSVEVVKLQVNLTRKESDEDGSKLKSAINKIAQIAEASGYRIYDKLQTPNVCLLLVECNSMLVNEIGKIDLVTQIERSPDFYLEKLITAGPQIPLGTINPPTGNTAILVMDSGIIRHPLLDPAIPPDGIVGLTDKAVEDERLHGTMVSGNSLYGNLEPYLTTQNFQPKFWICSAKIFYQSGSRVIQDDTRLPHSLIEESLTKIKNVYPLCRVVNLSFGDKSKVMAPGKNQFPMAALIDDLSMRFPDTVFTIAIGNIDDSSIRHENFPDYLCDDRPEIKLHDPASSVHALSVGALQEDSSGNHLPSDITRTGPGLDEMIKPELVELGGGFHKKMVVLNPDFLQRTFTLKTGTSFSSPIISNYVAELIEKYPTYSRNLIIALLLSSTKYPEQFPAPFPKLNSSTNNTSFLTISNVYGYGKPILSRALMSDDDRVVFKHEGSLKPDHVRYFAINIPGDFVTVKGDRMISVSLVFDPAIRSTRADYFGTRMEFHLFRNRTVEELQEKYNELDIAAQANDEEKVPEDLVPDEIKFKPSSNLRKKTPHQKGIANLSSRYEIDSTHPLTLAVVCQKKWKMPSDFEQNFSVVVTMEHEKEIELYDKIQTLNQVRVTPARVRV